MSDDGAPSSTEPSKQMDQKAEGSTRSGHILSEEERIAKGMSVTEAMSHAHIEKRGPPGGELIPESELQFDEDGHVIIPDEHLLIANRVLQLFARFPDSAAANRFVKFSPEYDMRQNIRINAMRWLKPGQIPSVKEIIKAKQAQEQDVLQASGIRLGRTMKKRLLPNQIGQVLIDQAQNVESQSLLSYVVPTHIEKELVESAITQNAKDSLPAIMSSPTATEQAPVKKAAGFKAVNREDLHGNFRVHPSVDAAPLSAPTRTTHTRSEVEMEVVEDEPATKRSKSNDSTPVPVPFSRPTHPSNYSAQNPQPRAEEMEEEERDITLAPAVHTAVVEDADGDYEDVDHKVDISKDEFLAVNVPTGLQTEEEVARIAQRYGRAFTGQNVEVSHNGKVVNPSSSVSACEVVDGEDETEEEAGVDVVADERNATGGMSTKNKVVRQGKQEKQAWSSKAGVYGGAFKVEDEDSLRQARESAAQAATEQLPVFLQEGRPRAHKKPVPCYVCKTHYKIMHHFYDRMCPTCADFNYRKRFQTADMLIRRMNKETGQVNTIQRVCFVTGARVKIGFEIALKLLRAGAFVIATSRFPHDTALRFYREPDFDQWKDCLHVYGCDFRVISSVEMLCKHILHTYPRLDLIMNNAAQTIRRPPQFYRHLVQTEAAALDTLPVECRQIVKDFIPTEVRDTAQACAAALLTNLGVSKSLFALEHKPPAASPAAEPDADADVVTPIPITTDETPAASSETFEEALAAEKVTIEEMSDEHEHTSTTTSTDAPHVETAEEQLDDATKAMVPIKDFVPNAVTLYDDDSDRSTRLVTMLSLPQAAVIKPAFLTQIPLVAGDEDKPEDKVLFPVNVYDKDDQQVDLRPKQTWVLQADEVSTVEMAEVQFVNQMAPFIINTKLKPLMKRSGDPCWIVNVSSMEGKFRGFKDITHPHTNMAKAALNMLTHTASKDYAADRIFMNAVDTGWVTEELPHAIALRKAKSGFAPPLDEIDGAARCLDPIFTSLLTGVYEFGKFFKDYGESHW